MKVLLSIAAFTLVANFTFADTTMCKKFYTDTQAARSSKSNSAKFSAETLQRLQAFVKTITGPVDVSNIPPTKLSLIESLRTPEVPYEVAKHSIIEKLREIQIGVNEEKLAELLLAFENRDQSALNIIAQAVHDKSSTPALASPKLSRATESEVEELRESSLPFQVIFVRIREKLESAGINNAKAITTELLQYENLSKSVREVIDASYSTKSNVINLPRTEDIANLVLQTKRFEIRAIGADKLREAMRAWGDPKTATMSGDHISQQVGADLLRMGRTKLAEVKDKHRPFINFGIYMDGKLVGMSQVAAGQEDTIFRHNIGNYNEKWVSISYHLASSAWGQGIATEAVTRLVKFAFETLNVTGIHAEVISTNTSSENVLKKVGFENFQNYPGQPHGTKHFYMNRLHFEGSIQKASGL